MLLRLLLFPLLVVGIGTEVAQGDYNYAVGLAMRDYFYYTHETSYFQTSEASVFASIASQYDENMFFDHQLATSMIDYATSMLSELPSSDQQYVLSRATGYYTRFTSIDQNVNTLLEFPSTTPTQTQWDTEIIIPANQSATYQTYYKLARCNALCYDIATYGREYNQMAITNPGFASSLNNVVSAYSTESDVLRINLECDSLLAYLSQIPWSGRILQGAKSSYLILQMNYNTPTPDPDYMTVTYYQPWVYISTSATVATTTTIGPSEAASASVPTDTGSYITTTTTLTSRSVNTETPLASMTSTPDSVVNKTDTMTIEYNGQNIFSAVIEGLLIDYRNHTDDYISLITSNSNLQIVQNYTSMIEDYKTRTSQPDLDEYESIVKIIYTFANIIPWRSRIWDGMGWWYTNQMLSQNEKTHSFSQGAGQFFTQLYNPQLTGQLDARLTSVPALKTDAGIGFEDS
ncbi:hypothetical protein OGAPHI_002195 [Ogataea philodendri]|uniref:Uncharacterized protein n=1 Tax=Ogataea philodendri TaxID=1378263 RepID=A0A9P8PB01_9ASCO|nr:uncharacterized protein OGAPHI_002195 [Ogataea philodendri]KAH3668441.1 hypothetical protein OGAPHI_002195 [Ogataea philodendri]